MLVQEKNVVVAKEKLILPGVHLEEAKYREVIERQIIEDQTSIGGRIRMCVSSDVELRKCQVMRNVAYSRDVRPEFECILKDLEKCSTALKNNEADVIVVQAKFIEKRDLEGLKPILFESFDDDAEHVIVVDAETTTKDLKTFSL